MIAIRIELKDEQTILVKRINYDRFSFHGFGSFIWKLKPEEVSISQAALNLLETRLGSRYTSLGDLAGLDFSYSDHPQNQKYKGFHLSYGFLGCELDIPIEDVLIDSKSYANLLKSNISDQTLSVDLEDLKRWKEIEGATDAQANKIVKNFYAKEFIPKD